MNTDVRKNDAADILPEAADKETLLHEALLLWLRWNDAHLRITSSLFQNRQNSGEIEQSLDQLDQLRLEAVRRSQHALDAEL